MTSAASRCFASIVNKVRLQLVGIWPLESRLLYSRRISVATLVGMCLKTCGKKVWEKKKNLRDHPLAVSRVPLSNDLVARAFPGFQ